MLNPPAYQPTQISPDTWQAIYQQYQEDLEAQRSFQRQQQITPEQRQMEEQRRKERAFLNLLSQLRRKKDPELYDLQQEYWLKQMRLFMGNRNKSSPNEIHNLRQTLDQLKEEYNMRRQDILDRRQRAAVFPAPTHTTIKPYNLTNTVQNVRTYMANRQQQQQPVSPQKPYLNAPVSPLFVLK